MYIMSMDYMYMYILTGRAFNRLMEETFHEKQIEVIVHVYTLMYTPQNAYSEEYPYHSLIPRISGSHISV